jgi:hypothetical protein
VAHADYSVTGGKLVYLQEENPCSCWGRKNPMSYLSRIKNPNLPCSSVAAALRAYSYVLSHYLLDSKLVVESRELLIGFILCIDSLALYSSVRDRWIGSRSKSKSIGSIGSGSRSKLYPFLIGCLGPRL